MKIFTFFFSLLFLPLAVAIDNIPTDTEQYIYGLGIDIDHGKAQKLAQADITHKLSSRIQSSMAIDESKEDNKTVSNISQRTTATSHEIELPNIHVLSKEQKDGQWWILIRVERALIKQALQQKLNDISDELSFIIDDYSDSAGPACWFSLTENTAQKEQLHNLLPAYIGSGGDNASVLPYKKQISSFDRLYKKCRYQNKYQISYPNNTPVEFKRAFEQAMKHSGYKLTNKAKKLGKMELNLNNKYSFLYKNHINIINFQLTIFDENGDVINHKKLKSKGTSFNNKSSAIDKSNKSLIKKLKALMET